MEIKPHLSRINVVHPKELNGPVRLGHCNIINLKVNTLLDFQEVVFFSLVNQQGHYTQESNLQEGVD